MKSSNCGWSVFKVACRLPGGGIVSDPANKVLELSADKFGVKNFFDFPLKVVVDDDRWWGWLCLALKRIFGDRFEERDVEDWVNFHGRGESEFICMARDFLGDFEFS